MSGYYGNLKEDLEKPEVKERLKIFANWMKDPNWQKRNLIKELKEVKKDEKTLPRRPR